MTKTTEKKVTAWGIAKKSGRLYAHPYGFESPLLSLFRRDISDLNLEPGERVVKVTLTYEVPKP